MVEGFPKIFSVLCSFSETGFLSFKIRYISSESKNLISSIGANSLEKKINQTKDDILIETQGKKIYFFSLNNKMLSHVAACLPQIVAPLSGSGHFMN